MSSIFVKSLLVMGAALFVVTLITQDKQTCPKCGRKVKHDGVSMTQKGQLKHHFHCSCGNDWWSDKSSD